MINSEDQKMLEELYISSEKVANKKRLHIDKNSYKCGGFIVLTLIETAVERHLSEERIARLLINLKRWFVPGT
jgi:hypothetical protein